MAGCKTLGQRVRLEAAGRTLDGLKAVIEQRLGREQIAELTGGVIMSANFSTPHCVAEVTERDITGFEAAVARLGQALGKS
jgi:hypothetical protein